MSDTTGLLIVYTKCNKTSEEAEWSAWYDDVHLPDLFASGNGPTVATRWELRHKPVLGMPGLGFTNVTIYEFRGGDVAEQVARLAPRVAELREAGRIHPTHSVIDAHTFVAHGEHRDKPRPSPELRGHILAYVLSNDPRRETEWTRWYDAEHIPDMMASGAFSAATRWERSPRLRYGTNYITLYDVAHESVDTAVEMSAAVMPGLIAAGRKHPVHTGALTLTLVPCGKYGGAGFRG
ncbi:MAG TPA: hypothetical protein VGQ20_17150 [Acidimicrobiales bacterium]|jgi:hypothetical protein|nr:hypothetical protein [Acidimicrobiales bacterium]